MTLASADLPTDPEGLRTFAAALRAELAEKDLALAARDAELHAKTLHIEKLRAEPAALRRARFGRSSERLDRAIDQRELAIGDLEEGEAEREARTAAAGRGGSPTAKRRDRRPPGRKPLPGHLPRETVVHAPPCSCPSCGGTVLSKVGEDEREVLEYVPSYFKVVRHLRPKLSCRACEAIAQAPVPALPIERGRPGPGLLAHVLVSKYCDHLPLYRQGVIYARAGVDLDRSTLADWVGHAVFLLVALADANGRHARRGEAVHADDTPVPVLDPGRGRTKTGRLWVLVRDERPWGSAVPPAAFYLYSPDRKGEHAEELLGGCRGFLHTRTATPASAGSTLPSRGPGRRGWPRWRAGATPGGDCTRSTSPPPRRSRRRRWSGSRTCSRSSGSSAARGRKHASRPAGNARCRCSRS